MPIYPTQERTIDPFSDRNSANVNKFSQILTRGKNVILNHNDFQLTKLSNTTFKVSTGSCIIDNVLINVTNDTVIDITNTSSFFSNGTTTATGKYYVCLKYNYSRSRPAPQAGFVILKPNEHGLVTVNKLLFIGVLNIIQSSGVYIIDTVETIDNSDLTNGQRQYLDFIGGIYETLPTFDSSKHVGMIAYELNSNLLYYGGISSWNKVSTETLNINTSSASVGDIVYIDSSGNIVKADKNVSDITTIGVVLISGTSGLIGNGGLFNVNCDSANKGDYLTLSSTAGKVEKAITADHKRLIIGRAMANASGGKVLAFVYPMNKSFGYYKVSVDNGGGTILSGTNLTDKELRLKAGTNVSLTFSETATRDEIQIDVGTVDLSPVTNDINYLKATNTIVSNFSPKRMSLGLLNDYEEYTWPESYLINDAGSSLFDGEFLWIIDGSTIKKIDFINKETSAFVLTSPGTPNRLFQINNFIVLVTDTKMYVFDRHGSLSTPVSTLTGLPKGSAFGDSVCFKNNIIRIYNNEGIAVNYITVNDDGSLTDQGESTAKYHPAINGISNITIFADVSTTTNPFSATSGHRDLARMGVYVTYVSSGNYYHYYFNGSILSTDPYSFFSVESYELISGIDASSLFLEWVNHPKGFSLIDNKAFVFFDSNYVVFDISSPINMSRHYYFGETSIDKVSTYFDGNYLIAATAYLDSIQKVFFINPNTNQIDHTRTLNISGMQLRRHGITGDGTYIYIPTYTKLIKLKSYNDTIIQKSKSFYEEFGNHENSQVFNPEYIFLGSVKDSYIYYPPTRIDRTLTDGRFHWWLAEKDNLIHLVRVPISDWNKEIYSYGKDKRLGEYCAPPQGSTRYRPIGNLNISPGTDTDPVSFIYKDGLILISAYDNDKNLNVLKIYDAITMEELRSIDLPYRINFFNGRYDTVYIIERDGSESRGRAYSIKKILNSTTAVFLGDLGSGNTFIIDQTIEFFSGAISRVGAGGGYITFIGPDRAIRVGSLGSPIINGVMTYTTFDFNTISPTFNANRLWGGRSYQIFGSISEGFHILDISESTYNRTVLSNFMITGATGTSRKCISNYSGSKFLIVVTYNADDHIILYEIFKNLNGTYTVYKENIYRSAGTINAMFYDSGGLKFLDGDYWTSIPFKF